MTASGAAPPPTTPRRAVLEQTFAPGVLFLSVAGYSAADTAAGGQEPIKLELQREAGYRTALERGIGIVKEFAEIGPSATALRNRPTMRQLFRYLREHPEISHVIFPGVYRFAGTREHATLLKQHFRNLKVRVLLVRSDRAAGSSSSMDRRLR